MARDRKKHASDKEVPAAPPVAVSSNLAMGQQRQQFLAMIRALAIEAARAEHETGLAKTPDAGHSNK